MIYKIMLKKYKQVRLEIPVHSRLKIEAVKKGMTLNQYIKHLTQKKHDTR